MSANPRIPISNGDQQQVDLLKQVVCLLKNQDGTVSEGIREVTPLNKQRFRATGTNVYAAPYRSISITAFSDDVSIDGQPVEQGFVEGISSNANEVYTQDTVVEGTDYFVTITFNV